MKLQRQDISRQSSLLKCREMCAMVRVEWSLPQYSTLHHRLTQEIIGAISPLRSLPGHPYEWFKASEVFLPSAASHSANLTQGSVGAVTVPVDRCNSFVRSITHRGN